MSLHGIAYVASMTLARCGIRTDDFRRRRVSLRLSLSLPSDRKTLLYLYHPLPTFSGSRTALSGILLASVGARLQTVSREFMFKYLLKPKQLKWSAAALTLAGLT